MLDLIISGYFPSYPDVDDIGDRPYRVGRPFKRLASLARLFSYGNYLSILCLVAPSHVIVINYLVSNSLRAVEIQSLALTEPG